MNRKNLRILADYLESKKLKAAFSMETYSADGESYKPNCGAVGCAIGHGPYAGIPKRVSESWDAYDTRVFGLQGEALRWCFSSRWAEIDNTPEGAAKRIRYLLEHGAPPDDFLNHRPWNKR